MGNNILNVSVRSRGVAFWGWYYIIIGIIGFLKRPYSAHYHLQLLGESYFIITVLLSWAFFTCGLYLLQLKELARKAVIALNVISIIVFIYYLFFVYLRIDQLAKNMTRLGPITGSILVIVILIYYLIPIYFFSRPKVKEQFK